MIDDFESLSSELEERMAVFSKTQKIFQDTQQLGNRVEHSIDHNHLYIQKLSDILKFVKEKNIQELKDRSLLKKKSGEDISWMPFKSKRQILEENLNMFRQFYYKKQAELERYSNNY